ncbi:MAG: C39 family peptidase [Melioribacteraceae bacterium]|nr:C39 family peptidase [Melioribacteraceae bacterium]
MNKRFTLYISLLTIIITASVLRAQVYPDQHYILRIDSIKTKIETSEGIKISDDGKSIVLQDNSLNGYFILREQTSQQPFNQGLPSWNGSAPGSGGSFKVQIRFPYGNSWSPWLTVGYWKNNIWSDYGTTSYGGGKIDYDWASIYTYVSKWQYKVILTRNNLTDMSPSIHKLSLFVSDSRTTSNVNISQIVADNPAAFFIPTSFIHQYSVDSQIGGDICSPTTVSMILRSYSISVDPYQFALTTYDPYYKMFGIWPRVVQNGSEYGLDGAVTRYRTWSEARKVLENGGRIGMSIGQPLYTGHLIMLAGFDNNGNPIVHDPAKSNGYSYVYNKSSLSQSWFSKGGVAYTFYPKDNVVSVDLANNKIIPDNFELYQNYPNPFNPVTSIKYQITVSDFVSLKVYDAIGSEVATLVNETKSPGTYEVTFDAANLTSGVYVYRMQVGNNVKMKKLVVLK